MSRQRNNDPVLYVAICFDLYCSPMSWLHKLLRQSKMDFERRAFQTPFPPSAEL